jgi:hypothetical protein
MQALTQVALLFEAGWIGLLKGLETACQDGFSCNFKNTDYQLLRPYCYSKTYHFFQAAGGSDDFEDLALEEI